MACPSSVRLGPETVINEFRRLNRPDSRKVIGQMSIFTSSFKGTEIVCRQSVCYVSMCIYLGKSWVYHYVLLAFQSEVEET